MVSTKAKTRVSAVMIFCAIVSCIFTTAAAMREDRILKGIYINDTDVGGMYREEAMKKLSPEDEKLNDRMIFLWYGDRLWRFSHKEAGCHFDVEKTVDKAIEISKSYNIVGRTLINLGLKKPKEHIKMDLVYDSNKVKGKVDEISKELNKEPVEAEITYSGGRFEVIKDIPGRQVDEKKLETMIKDSIGENMVQSVLEIPVRLIAPKRTYALLKGIRRKISSYGTNFNSYNINRATNVKLGAEAVNGTLIMPGEVFSLNKVLGPRISQFGYKEAPIIIDGRLVRGLGGGVCQVASTLYNAALLANLDIVERENHSLPLSYVGLGRDATISWDYLDLKIKNNREYPVYIRGIVSGGAIRFEMYSDDTTPDMQVEIKTEIIEVIKPNPKVIKDSSMPEGMEKVKIRPKKGYKVKTYRKTYINNKLVRDELLSEDIYKAVNGVIIRGTGG